MSRTGHDEYTKAMGAEGFHPEDEVTYTTPAPASFLDCAADCIDIGDEIGRCLYRLAHAAGVTFTPFAHAEQTVIGETSRAFAAKFAGRCAVSGQFFGAGAEVYRTDDGQIVSRETVRAWEFGRVDSRTVSPWVRPDEAAVTEWLTAGRMVSTLNRMGVKRHWRLVGGKVEETSCIGGPVTLTNRKAMSAFWNTVASKAQAVRVHR